MRPILVIGLGGAGIRVTTSIYEKFLEHNPTQEERSKLICLCFDTDMVDICETRKKLPREWVVDIAPESRTSFVIDHLSANRRTSVQDWFDTAPKNLMHDNLSNGTAMRRQNARLALLGADAKRKLLIVDQSIAQLKALSPNKYVDVRIVCSLAGGTGSGIFLQIAYYVKEVMRNQHINNPETIGYFLVAEVFSDVVCYNKAQFEVMQANTYFSFGYDLYNRCGNSTLD